MRRTRRALLLALLVSAGCGGPRRTREEPAPTTLPTSVATIPALKHRSEGDPVAASIEPARISVRPGDSFELSVVLDVAPLYEIYPLAAPPPGVATQLELALPTGLQAHDGWTKPPTVRSDALDGHPVHAGQVKFARTIRVSDGVTPGEYHVTCSVRYQACSARLCLAPVSFELLATVLVKPAR